MKITIKYVDDNYQMLMTYVKVVLIMIALQMIVDDGIYSREKYLKPHQIYQFQC